MFSLHRNRRAAYNSENSTDREDRIQKLKTEMADHIRCLGDYEILSAEWLRMVESVQQIANVAFMEKNVAHSNINNFANNTSDVLTLKNAAHTTLWDTQQNEFAIRILIEEGKLNLLLRILNRFITFKFTAQYATHLQAHDDALEEKCLKFEQSVGILLCISLCHVEALQIIDIPLLISHIATVLSTLQHKEKDSPTASSVSSSDTERCQENLSIYYLYSIASSLEVLNEERVMDCCAENCILPLILNYIHTSFNQSSVATMAITMKTLSYFVSSEIYQSDFQRFLSNQTDYDRFVGLRTYLDSDKLPSTVLPKREVQSLWDELGRIQRSYASNKIYESKEN